MKKWWFLILLLSGCRPDRTVNTSFYYWKSVYKHNITEQTYLHRLRVSQLYVRIMDVNNNKDADAPVPAAPIIFEDPLPGTTQIVPVVFIVNSILCDSSHRALNRLAAHISQYVKAKVQQSGKRTYKELQIDCDWSPATRDNYFYLLNQLKIQPEMKGRQLSATLRLHQLESLQRYGVPPVSHAMLMCYNTGNLRRYGQQNSILELDGLKKHAEKNLKNYPLQTDFGLPLFEWAVAFRDQKYIGISKKLNLDTLLRSGHFKRHGMRLYVTQHDLPQYGLLRNDVIRWEDVSPHDLMETSKFLARQLKTDTANVVYFHLDEGLLKTYPHESLEEITDLWL